MAHLPITGPASPHPVQALLGAYPLAFLSAPLLTDLAYAATAQMQWANFSVWLIAAGVVMGLVAAAAGTVDRGVARRQHRLVHRGSALHGVLTVVTLVMATINGFIHSRDAWTSVVPAGLVLSALTAVLVLVTAWVGYAAAPARTGTR